MGTGGLPKERRPIDIDFSIWNSHLDIGVTEKAFAKWAPLKPCNEPASEFLASRETATAKPKKKAARKHMTKKGQQS